MNLSTELTVEMIVYLDYYLVGNHLAIINCLFERWHVQILIVVFIYTSVKFKIWRVAAHLAPVPISMHSAVVETFPSVGLLQSS